MAQQEIYGPVQDPKPAADVVIDIPGVGVRSFPASLGLQQIEANANRLMREATGTSGAPARPAFDMFDEQMRLRPEYRTSLLKKVALNPEITGGVAGALATGFAPETGGASLLIPPAVGAITSLLSDAMKGEHDPSTRGVNALKHAALNALPAGIGALARGGGAAMASFPAAAASALESKVPAIGGLIGGAAGGMKGAAMGTATGAIMKTVAEMLKTGKTAASTLGTKILPNTGGLNARGLALVKNNQLINTLRAILAGASVAPSTNPYEEQP